MRSRQPDKVVAVWCAHQKRKNNIAPFLSGHVSIGKKVIYYIIFIYYVPFKYDYDYIGTYRAQDSTVLWIILLLCFIITSSLRHAFTVPMLKSN